MKKYVNSITYIAILSTFLGCEDIIEDDITDDLITVIAPLNDAEIEGNSVQFRWNQVDGADEYRIQIANETNNRIIIDSLVQSSVFDLTINPGNYKWRVRGENFAYQTSYSFDSSFKVFSSTDLSQQVVELNTPVNNFYSNTYAMTFIWQGIQTATFYKFQILKVDNSNETVVFEDTNVLDTSITLGQTNLTEDAEYIWQVSAENETSFTDYFRRRFFIDTQNPPAPNLISPTNGQVFNINQNITFSWNFNNDTGNIQSGISSTIEVASDENFGNILFSESLVDQTIDLTINTAGSYFWRVKGNDGAGNEGQFNSSGRFTVN